jgi:hypothetical protein
MLTTMLQIVKIIDNTTLKVYKRYTVKNVLFQIGFGTVHWLLKQNLAHIIHKFYQKK